MIKYHLEQIVARFKELSYKPKLYNGTVYTNSSNDIYQYMNICFFLDHPRIMHLGDQLFFKPLFGQLRAANFSVSVIVSKKLEFLFEQEQRSDLSPSTTLFVTTTRQLVNLKSKFGSSIKYFLFDTMSLGVDEPITNYIVNKFSDYYHLGEFLKPVSREDFIIKYFKHDFNLLDNNGKYIIFNNYFDSGIFRVFPKDRKLLLETLVKEKDEFKVIHIGTEGEKKQDKFNYSRIVDIDLRGKTSLQDIYYIFSSFEIVKLYAFDSLCLHFAYIFDVPATLMLKRFYKKGEQKQKMISFSTMYHKKVKNINII